MELGIDSIDISTQNPDTFAHDSIAFAKISAFFDKVVANRDQQSTMQQHRDEFTEATVSPVPISTASRHQVLDSFDSPSPYPSVQTHRQYSAVTRNQRASSASRNVHLEDELSPFEPSKAWSEGPHVAMPHSRNSKMAYTNILDAP